MSDDPAKVKKKAEAKHKAAGEFLKKLKEAKSKMNELVTSAEKMEKALDELPD